LIKGILHFDCCVDVDDHTAALSSEHTHTPKEAEEEELMCIKKT